MIYLTISLIILGLLLRAIAIFSLGECFTLKVKTPVRLVTTGIYKHIRHPAYLGSMIVLFGMSCHSFLVFPMMLLAFWYFSDRADREDDLLEERFGIYFISYKKSTKMFIPMVL